MEKQDVVNCHKQGHLEIARSLDFQSRITFSPPESNELLKQTEVEVKMAVKLALVFP